MNKQLNRRKFLKIAAAGTASLTFSNCTLKQSENGLKKKPNIVLVVADDLGCMNLGCYGQQKIKTPVLDQLAAKGIKFNRFYAGNALCLPSRVSLMTGLHSGHSRVRENGKIINTHGDYPEVMRQTAKEENVPLIDLFKMSADLFESMGVEGSKKAFVHYPAGTFPGQNEELNDDTHFNNYGAYELAKCVVESIRSNQLELKRYLVDDLQTFNPNHPDSFDNWSFPNSPAIIYQ